MEINSNSIFFRGEIQRIGAERRGLLLMPVANSCKNKCRFLGYKLFRLAAVLLICSFFFAPKANAILIVANDPNVLNKINAGLNATLEIFELIELISEEFGNRIRLTDTRVAGTLRSTAYAVGVLIDPGPHVYGFAVGKNEFLQALTPIIPLGGTGTVAYAGALVNVSLALGAVGTVADIAEIFYPQGPTDRLELEGEGNYAVGPATHSSSASLAVTGTRQKKPEGGFFGRFIKIVQKIVNIVIDPPPALNVTEKVHLDLNFNGEQLWFADIEVAWDDALNDFELTVTDPLGLLAANDFLRSSNPETGAITWQLEPSKTLEFIRPSGSSDKLVVTSNTSVTGISTVPEPTTLALFGIGLLGLAGMRRRRKAA